MDENTPSRQYNSAAQDGGHSARRQRHHRSLSPQPHSYAVTNTHAPHREYRRSAPVSTKTATTPHRGRSETRQDPTTSGSRRHSSHDQTRHGSKPAPMRSALRDPSVPRGQARQPANGRRVHFGEDEIKLIPPRPGRRSEDNRPATLGIALRQLPPEPVVQCVEDVDASIWFTNHPSDEYFASVPPCARLSKFFPAD